MLRNRVLNLTLLAAIQFPAPAGAAAGGSGDLVQESLMTPAGSSFSSGNTDGGPRPVLQSNPNPGTFLSSGDTVTFSLPPRNNKTLFNQGYRFFVPPGQTQLTITLSTLTPGANLDLFVRFGQDVVVAGGSAVADFSSTQAAGDDQVVVTASNSPPLQSGFYFIGIATINTGIEAFGSITATVSGGPAPGPVGVRLTSGVGAGFSHSAVGSSTLVNGEDSYRIDVPQGASQLTVQLAMSDPAARFVMLVRHGFDSFINSSNRVITDQSSPGGSNNQLVTVSLSSDPALRRGTYWIAISLTSTGIPFNGTITATVSTGSQPPSIGLSVGALTFNGIEGSPVANQTFTVQNSGGGTLNYSISADQSWVSVQPSSGSSSGEIDTIIVSINTSGLLAGAHNAVITVDQTGGSLSASLSVTLNLGSLGPPTIQLSTNQLTFDVVTGSAPAAMTFSVRNGGGGTLDYTISSDQTWLSATPSSGVSSGEADPILALADPTGLQLGTFQGRLMIQDQNLNLTASVSVTLNVLPNPPVISLSVLAMTFTTQIGQPNPPLQTFTVGNSGGGTLNFEITSSEPWISVSPASGSVTGDLALIQVSVDTTGLEPGLHTATLAVSESPPGQAQPKAITVLLNAAVGPPTVSVSTAMLTFQAVEMMNPPDQQFTVSNAGGGELSYSISADQPWVSVSPEAGASQGEPDTVTVSIDTMGLPPAVYNATITVSQIGGAAEMMVGVVLNLAALGPPAIELSTGQLDFVVGLGAPPTFQPFTLRNAGMGMINFMITSDAAWLSAQPSEGTAALTPVEIMAVVDAGEMPLGTFEGQLQIQDVGHGLSATVAVNLTITESAPVPQLSATSLTFMANLGDPNPDPQTVTIQNTGGGDFNYVASASVPWLSVTPAAGAVMGGSEGSIEIAADTGGLGPGSHEGQVTISEALPASIAQTAQVAPLVITVVAEISAGGTVPFVSENGVVDAASFIPFGLPGHAMAPGSIVSIFGQNLATEILQAGSIPLPTNLGGLSITIEGLPAPLFFVSAGQINAQLPGGLTGTTAMIVVTTAGGSSNPRTIQINPFSPAIFTVGQQGSGQGWVLFANTVDVAAPVGTLRAAGFDLESRPAIAGEDVLTIFANGLGAVAPPIEDGRNSFDPEGFRLRTTTTRPVVLIGGTPVADQDVLFSGLAPQFVGLYQVNIQLPPGLPTGEEVSIVIRMGEVESRDDVTIAVQ